MKNRIKKIIAAFCAAAFVLCTVPSFGTYASGSAADIYSEYENSGVSCNLETFASFCVRYFGLEGQAPAQNIYTDLNDSAADVLRLVAMNVISGCGDGTIGTSMTRERGYIILSRLMYNRIGSSGAVLAPFVSQDMCTAAYWIERAENPYQILLTKEQIQSLNKSIINKSDTCMTDLSALPERFNGKSYAASLSKFKSPSTHYINGSAVPESYYEAIRKNIANAEVSSDMPLKYGFATRYTVMKAYPYSDYLSDAAGDPEWDDFACSGVLCNEPLAIYFLTADKKFAYVRSSICSGWVAYSDIAVCSGKSEWEYAKPNGKILVVTGNRVYLEPGSADDELSEKLLTMGTVLKLIIPEDPDARLINRAPWNNYVVSMPGRRADGSYYEKKAMIPMNRDVHQGYLDFTQAGIITQAFKCLGDRYGWGGMLKSPDCSAYALNVYRCFGLNIPRNTTWQSLMPVRVDDIGGLAGDEKVNAIKSAPMGSILQFNGHEMIYLGESGGRLYTINDVSSIKNPSTDDGSVLRVRGVIVNDLLTVRMSGHTWLDDMNKIIVPWQ